MEWKYDLTEVMEFMIPGLALCIETGGYLRKSWRGAGELRDDAL